MFQEQLYTTSDIRKYEFTICVTQEIDRVISLNLSRTYYYNVQNCIYETYITEGG